MKKLIAIGLTLISLSAFADNWQDAFLKDSQQVGNINGMPVLNCTYVVGAFGTYTFTARMNEWACPINVRYSVERDKWTR